MNGVNRAPSAIGPAKHTILGFLVLLIVLSSHAQTTEPPGNATTTASSTPAAAQAPDDVTRRITDLVNAEKYAEAQRLTMGLLVAYPDDQRLIKTKSLLDKLLAPAISTVVAPDPARNIAPAQPAATAPATQLTGMDKVEYDSLIELGREAQQATDLDEQKKLLVQFMNDSIGFLQKHPDEMLLWQLRAAGALSLDGPLAGYQAGQKLLAAGAATSGDPNVSHLLAQLNLKGWMDKQQAEKQQAIRVASTPHAARSEAERILSEAIVTVLYANNVQPANHWKAYGFTADTFILTGQQGNDPRTFRYDQVRTTRIFRNPVTVTWPSMASYTTNLQVGGIRSFFLGIKRTALTRRSLRTRYRHSLNPRSLQNELQLANSIWG